MSDDARHDIEVSKWILEGNREARERHMSKPYQSPAVQQFADRFEPLGRDFVIDGGGKIGRYRVSANQRLAMITRFDRIGWPKWRTLGAILLVALIAAATWKWLGYAFRISTFLFWLSPLFAFAVIEERRRFRKALGALSPKDYLGASDPIYLRWIEERVKQGWGELLRSGLYLFWVFLVWPFKPLKTIFDWADLMIVASIVLLWVAPLIVKAWYQYRRPVTA